MMLLVDYIINAPVSLKKKSPKSNISKAQNKNLQSDLSNAFSASRETAAVDVAAPVMNPTTLVDKTHLISVNRQLLTFSSLWQRP